MVKRHETLVEEASEQAMYGWILRASIKDLDLLAKYVVDSEIQWGNALAGIQHIAIQFR